MDQKDLKSYLTGISHSVASVMAGSRHTLSCYLSKPRSSLEAGMRQSRVWLERVCCFVLPIVSVSKYACPLRISVDRICSTSPLDFNIKEDIDQRVRVGSFMHRVKK